LIESQAAAFSARWLPEAHLARYFACNRHPDHGTLATFRRRFGNQFESAFVQVLQPMRTNSPASGRSASTA